MAESDQLNQVFKKTNEKELVYFHIKKIHTRISSIGTTPDRNIYVSCEKRELSGQNKFTLVPTVWESVLVEQQWTALCVSSVRGGPWLPLLTAALLLTELPLRTQGSHRGPLPLKTVE